MAEMKRKSAFSGLEKYFKSVKLSDVQLFNDYEKIAPRHNNYLTIGFLISALFIVVISFASKTGLLGRCEYEDNTPGWVSIASPSDCDYLDSFRPNSVTCTSVCGYTFSQFDYLKSDINKGTVYPLQYFMWSAWTETDEYSGMLAGDYYNSRDQFYCNNRQSSSQYSFEVDDHIFIMSSRQSCESECQKFNTGNLVNATFFGGFRYPYHPVSLSIPQVNVNCSCSQFLKDFPTCTCDQISQTIVLPWVVNSLSCRRVFSDFYVLHGNSQVNYASAPFIDDCHGVYKNPTLSCTSIINHIGVMGGYLSLLYSGFSFIFFFILSVKRHDRDEASKPLTSFETEQRQGSQSESKSVRIQLSDM